MDVKEHYEQRISLIFLIETTKLLKIYNNQQVSAKSIHEDGWNISSDRQKIVRSVGEAIPLGTA